MYLLISPPFSSLPPFPSTISRTEDVESARSAKQYSAVPHEASHRRSNQALLLFCLQTHLLRWSAEDFDSQLRVTLLSSFSSFTVDR
jgi:hypothetical protein